MVSLTFLDDSEKELISKLLRMRHACNGFDHTQMEHYLKTNYEIDVNGPSKLSRLEKGVGMDKTPFVANWRKFIEQEKTLLSNEANGGGSLNFPYKFNYGSAMRLSEAAMGAERCIFFNTYINLNEWHNALIQMHLCVQKSIEQKNNLLPVCECHKLKNSHINKRKGAIDECSNNPPSYKHYRILFLPYTHGEFKSKMEEKTDGLSENLKFSTLMHRMLSIQLAVLTVTDLANIMIEHPKFFKDKQNLDKLGLSQKLSDLFDKNEDFLAQLQKDIKRMGKIPENKIVNEGIDFVYFDKKEANNNDLLWSAYYGDKEGLSYYPIKDAKYAIVKKAFSEIIFTAITTKQQSVMPFDILEFDPLYALFYKDNISVPFLGLLPKFDSFNRTGLANESFS